MILLRHRAIFVFAVILALGFIPRLLLLSKGPLHYDTVDLLMEMRGKAITEHGAIFPVASSAVIALGWIKSLFLPRISDLSVLLVFTAGMAALVPACVYLLFRRREGELSAAVFALLLSFLPLFFSVTTYGRIDHVLGLLFLALSVYSCLQKRSFACMIFTSLAISCRPECVFVFPGYFVYLFLEKISEKGQTVKEKLWALLRDFSVLAAGTFILWVAVSLVLGREKWFQAMFMKMVAGQFAERKPSDTVFFNFAYQQLLHTAYAVLRFLAVPIIFAVYGLFRKIRERKLSSPDIFFLVSFVVSFILISNIERAVDEHRYLLVPLFFLVYFSSCGIAALFRKEAVAWGITMACALSMLVPVLPILKDRHENAYQVDFARYLESVTQPGGVVIVQDEWIFIRYYTSREVLLPPYQCDMRDWLVFFDKIRALIKEGKPLYIVTTGLTYDPCLILRRFIERNFFLQTVGVHKNESWHPETGGTRFFTENIFYLVPVPDFAGRISVGP